MDQVTKDQAFDLCPAIYEILYVDLCIVHYKLHNEGEIEAIIASGDRRQAGPTLPPQGLRLEWVRYSDS